MLSPPRFTVRSLMVAVVLVAVDFVVVRGMLDGDWDEGVAFATLPMTNILILAAPRVRRGGSVGRFWIGFAIAGWSVAVLSAYLAYRHGAIFFRPANAIYPWETIRDPYYQTTYLCFIDAIVYTPPQILVAWLSGRLITGAMARQGFSPLGGA